MTEWMLAHPWMTFFGWCWATFWVGIGLGAEKSKTLSLFS